MSYNTEDLTNIDTAISEMAMGQRVGQVIYNGRQIKYADITLGELRELRATIVRSINASKRKRQSRIITGKGL